MKYILLLIIVLPIVGYSSAAGSETKSVDSVVSFERPYWIHTQLRVLGVEKAVLSLCGGELHTCKQAKKMLVRLTEQCSNVFLGIIDVNLHVGVPRDLYDTNDPELILLGKPKGSNSLMRFDLGGIINPDLIAVAMCPLESRIFGHVLSSFPGMLR